MDEGRIYTIEDLDELAKKPGSWVLAKEYQEHKVFDCLESYLAFYKYLSFSTMRFATPGTRSFVSIDTYIQSSMQGTLESIKLILANGRIADAYTLLRKYHDFITLNIYTHLYLKEHQSLENFFVEEVIKWMRGTEKAKTYNEMKQYIEKSELLEPITALLRSDNRYTALRERCNDHTHYNSYNVVMINDNQIFLKERLSVLGSFATDLDDLFVMHFVYLFFLMQPYMGSSDYVDCLDVGLTPVEGSQYWVSSIVQETFDKYIKTRRPDLAEVLKLHTYMELK